MAFLTLAVVLSIVEANVFLGLITWFTGYLLITGIRLARIRHPPHWIIDCVLAGFMLLVAIAMVIAGLRRWQAVSRAAPGLGL